MKRFWDKVDIGEDCWNWTAGLDSSGYGVFWHSPKTVMAHRWSWIQCNGPVPEGKELDHLCRNRACVNPDHLEPVTHLVNIRRGNTPRKNNRCGRCGLKVEGANALKPYKRASGYSYTQCLACKRERRRERERKCQA